MFKLTHLITEKEKKSSSYKENRLDSLSGEKVVKIKKYCKDYLLKLMRKLEKSGKLKKQGRSSSSNAGGHGEASVLATHTPSNGVAGHDKEDNDDGVEMTVEEAMDMDVGDDGDDDDDNDYDDLKPNSSPMDTPTPTGSSPTADNIANAYAQRRRRNQDHHDNNHDTHDYWGPPRRNYPDRLVSKPGYDYDSMSGWTR